MIASIATIALLFSATISAAPLKRDESGMCTPNFQATNSIVMNPATGLLWSITDQGSLFGAASTHETFRPEFTGQPANDFIIKQGEIPSNSLLLQPNQLGDIVEIGQVLPVGSPAFIISCQWCESPERPYSGAIASGCTVTSSSEGTTLTQNDDGTITLNDLVVEGSQYQLFDFAAAGTGL